MKVLIVSETPNTLDTYNDFFSNNGFATICYSWLVKALDNIEEINPEVILVNAVDYPRNWKVLIQNAKQVSKNLKHCIVVVPSDIDDDELQKIKTLDAMCVSVNFTTTDEASTILLKLNPKSSQTATEIPTPIATPVQNTVPTPKTSRITIESVTEKETINEMILTCTMPETRWEVSGKVEKYDYPTMIFTPNETQYVKLFTFGKKFTECTLYEFGLPSKISVQVQGYTDNSIEFCVIK